MQHTIGIGSEKASSSSGAASASSRSDDGKAPTKVSLTAESEEDWPTLGQSQEQSTKKKTKATSPRGEKRSSMERSRKGRPSRGVPLAPEEQVKLFHHEKPERLVKGQRERGGEKERTHQRRHSIQNEMRPVQRTVSKETNEMEMETHGLAENAQTPRETTTPRYGQGGRGRGRLGGRGRGGRGRGSHPRSYSHENVYYGMHPPAGMHPMYPPVHMMPPMYYPAVPFAPMPPLPGMMYPPGPHHPIPVPHVSREQILEAAKKQMEYYLGEENLMGDMFLRGKMDNDGWIPLAVIMSFKMLRLITVDANVILEALLNSEMAVVSEDMEFVRPKNHEQWVLSEDQQELAHIPEDRLPYVPRGSPRGAEWRQPNDNVFQFDEDHTGGDRETQDDREEFIEPDVDRLIVLIQSQSGNYTKGGVMDRGMAAAVNEGLAEYQQQLHPLAASTVRDAPRNHFFSSSLPKHASTSRASRRSVDDGHVRQSPSVGWILGTSPHPHTLSGTSPSVEGLHLGSSLPRFDHPGHKHLKDSNFVQVHYNKFYSRCIKDRNAKGFGKSDEMRTLYRFWCYFLRDNFNARMYEDFKKFSQEDSEEGEYYGIERLFNYYSYGLESTFNEALYSDFEDMTLLDYDQGRLYGLEKFWAFHHYGGIPEASDVHVNARLKELIDTQYSTLDDLRRKPEAAEPCSKETFCRCTSSNSSLSSTDGQCTMKHHMSSVPEAENVISVQNESLSVA